MEETYILQTLEILKYPGYSSAKYTYIQYIDWTKDYHLCHTLHLLKDPSELKRISLTGSLCDDLCIPILFLLT